MTRRRRCPPTAGVSVLEAVVALTLGFFALHLAIVTVQRSRDAQRAMTERIDVLGSLRLARYVSRRELRNGVPGRDWWIGGDSIALRAFRGTGLLCGHDGVTNEAVVSYHGDRLPEPDKDSVLLIHSNGEHTIARLASVGAPAPGCGEGLGPSAVWRLDRPVPADAVLARLFERGSYHLSDRALRYRRGGSGRQPLTPEVWSTPASRWDLSVERAALSLVPTVGRGGRGWSGFLAWRSPP